MKRYLLDTGIMGDFVNRRHGVPEKVQQAQQDGRDTEAMLEEL